MMARKQRRFGRRSVIALGLVAFVLIASVVIWRRSIGVSNARALAKLETRRRELESERTTLKRDIRDATNYSRVVAEAERRLHMHRALAVEVHNLAAHSGDVTDSGSSR